MVCLLAHMPADALGQEHAEKAGANRKTIPHDNERPQVDVDNHLLVGALCGVQTRVRFLIAMIPAQIKDGEAVYGSIEQPEELPVPPLH